MLLLINLLCSVYIASSFNKQKPYNLTRSHPRTHLYKTTDLGICGGDDANINDFPYMAALYDNSGFCFCSGSILSKDPGIILTAAHCLSGSMRNGHVVVGSTRWQNPIDPGAQSIYNSYYAIHPLYDSYEIQYDVGLIYLRAPIFIDTVTEVEVCSGAQTPSNGANLRIQGYGTTEQPQKPGLVSGRTDFINQETCDNIYDSEDYEDWILPGMQCMTNQGYNNAPSTDCYGDSGSPIMTLNTNNAIGIVSWGIDSGGDGCCPTDMPSVIADLCDPDIRNWVLNAIKGEQ